MICDKSNCSEIMNMLELPYIKKLLENMKIIKDWLFKAYLKLHNTVPSGLLDLHRYFKTYGPIRFKFHDEDGVIVAVSENFHYGSIVTFASTKEALDEKIKDAIMTSFGVPSSYSKEAAIRREGNEHAAYAAA